MSYNSHTLLPGALDSASSVAEELNESVYSSEPNSATSSPRGAVLPSKLTSESKESNLFSVPNLPQYKPQHPDSRDGSDEGDEYSTYDDDFDDNDDDGADPALTRKEIARLEGTFRRQLTKDEYVSSPATPRDYEGSQDGDSTGPFVMRAETRLQGSFRRQLTKDEYVSSPATPRDYEGSQDGDGASAREYSIVDLKPSTKTGESELFRQVSKDSFVTTPALSPREYESSQEGDADDAINILNADSADEGEVEANDKYNSGTTLASSLRASTVGALSDLAQMVERAHPSVPPSRIHDAPIGSARSIATMLPLISARSSARGSAPVTRRDEVDELVDDVSGSAAHPNQSVEDTDDVLMKDPDEVPQHSAVTDTHDSVNSSQITGSQNTANPQPITTSDESRLSLLRKKIVTTSAPAKVRAKSAASSKPAKTTSPLRMKSPPVERRTVTPSKLPRLSQTVTPVAAVTAASSSLTAPTTSSGNRVRSKKASGHGVEDVVSPSKIPVKKRPSSASSAPKLDADSAPVVVPEDDCGSARVEKQEEEPIIMVESITDSVHPTPNVAPQQVVSLESSQAQLQVEKQQQQQPDYVQTQLSSTFAERERELRDEITQLKAMLFDKQLQGPHSPGRLRWSAESLLTEDERSAPGLTHLIHGVANTSFTSEAVGATADGYNAAASGAVEHGGDVNETDTQSGVVERFVPKSVVAGMDGSVTMSKIEYEQLLRESATQEQVARTYERENKRLCEAMKSKEKQEASVKARFFDERQSLNAQLNRLRNQQHQTLSDSFATKGDSIIQTETNTTMVADAERLRRELALEMAVRDLKEELTSMKQSTGQREEELHSTIDKLRSENSHLRETTAKLDAQLLALKSANHDASVIDAERCKLQKEVSELKQKLLWYGENQVLIEDAQTTRAQALSIVAALKKELIKAGYRKVDITKLVASASKGDETYALNDSRASDTRGEGADISPSPRAKASSASRHPADIKKIAELERVIAELKESITKKHPDSLTTLIQASSLTASFQERREAQLDALAKQQQEAVQVKADYELRIRSLRQELEKVKSQYERRLEQLQSQVAGAHSAGKKVMNIETPRSYDGNKSSDQDGSDTSTRIRTLEEELARVRTFYARKVEEVQRKADQKIWYYKRGGQSPSVADDRSVTNATESAGSTAKRDSEEVENAAESSGDKVWRSDEEKQQYIAKIGMLETELNRTLDELTQTRAQLESQSHRIDKLAAQLSSTAPLNDSSYPAISNAEQMFASSRQPREDRKPSGCPRTAAFRVNTSTEFRKIQQLQELLAQSQAELAELKRAQAQETEKEQKRTSSLLVEVERLRLQLAEKPLPPQLQQFLLMEKQIRNLEIKFMRREQELQRTVEDIRAASKLERSRIAALHQQEIREKDEQLILLQEKLDRIVTTSQVRRALTDTSIEGNDKRELASISL